MPRARQFLENGCRHSNPKNWKEAPNSSTLNVASMPNSLSVFSASEMSQISALDLLPVTYGDSVDSYEDNDEGQETKKNSLSRLPIGVRTRENFHELFGIADATRSDLCVQHLLEGQKNLPTLAAKINIEETHDDPIQQELKNNIDIHFHITALGIC